MNKQAVVSKFSHVKPGDTEFKGGGLRDFFLYRDLGIADATSGQVSAIWSKPIPTYRLKRARAGTSTNANSRS